MKMRHEALASSSDALEREALLDEKSLTPSEREAVVDFLEDVADLTTLSREAFTVLPERSMVARIHQVAQEAGKGRGPIIRSFHRRLATIAALLLLLFAPVFIIRGHRSPEPSVEDLACLEAILDLATLHDPLPGESCDPICPDAQDRSPTLDSLVCRFDLLGRVAIEDLGGTPE